MCFIGVGLPVFARPCAGGVVSAGLTFLWPLTVCAARPLQAGALGIASAEFGLGTGAPMGAGGCSIGWAVVIVPWPLWFQGLGG